MRLSKIMCWVLKAQALGQPLGDTSTIEEQEYTQDAAKILEGVHTCERLRVGYGQWCQHISAP
jgi:hypothetical protein